MRLLLIALVTTVGFSSSLAQADPRPKYLGDKAPRAIKPPQDIILSGPIAPRDAIDWLRAIAPSFNWGGNNSLSKATLESRSRDAITLRTSDTHSVTLRVFRAPINLIALSERGVCCCGTCAARVLYFYREKGRLADVTDQVWPRFRFVTAGGTVDDDLRFELPRRGTTVSIRNLRANRIEYRLRWSRRTRRFEMRSKHRKASAPFPWRGPAPCRHDRHCWPGGRQPKLEEGSTGLLCIKGRCRPVPIPH